MRGLEAAAMRRKKELEDLGRLIVALHAELKGVEAKLGPSNDAKYAEHGNALRNPERALNCPVHSALKTS